MTEKYKENNEFRLADLLNAELTSSDLYNNELELVILHGEKVDVKHEDLLLNIHPYMDSFYIKAEQLKQFKDTLDHISKEISYYLDKEKK
jgi:hypothetical protein